MTWPSGRSATLLAGVFFAALGVRLGWTLWTSAEPTPFSDAQYYHATARSISEGHGYSTFFDAARGFMPGGDATALWPPGYPAYLGTAYAVFGSSLWVGRTVNIVIGALTIIPAYFIGRRLFNEGSALMGAAIVAILPSLAFWTPVLLSETLFGFLFGCAIALIVQSNRLDRSPSSRYAVGVGVLIGVATLVRGPARASRSKSARCSSTMWDANARGSTRSTIRDAKSNSRAGRS